MQQDGHFIADFPLFYLDLMKKKQIDALIILKYDCNCESMSLVNVFSTLFQICLLVASHTHSVTS